MSVIKKVNELSKSEFIKVFANIFENASWIAEDLYSKKPFVDFKDLSEKMINIFSYTTKENQLKILRNHPDLAIKAKIGSLTIDSKKEQSNAGLDQCTEKEFNEFQNLNQYLSFLIQIQLSQEVIQHVSFVDLKDYLKDKQ